MSVDSLKRLLEATGYFPNGEAAPGLLVGEAAASNRRGRDFIPDAVWRSASSLSVYFKYQAVAPDLDEVAKWRREIWNEGFAPLLWVISPERIELYNGFGAPSKQNDAAQNLLRTFEAADHALQEADALAGRLAIETGQTWQRLPVIDRKTSVDYKLLRDLHCLETDLVINDLERGLAQALIGRVIFSQYLIDRSIVSPGLLQSIAGSPTLPSILRSQGSAIALFSWMSRTFNGDMFPPSSAAGAPRQDLLNRVADFLEAVDPVTNQLSFFPYQFDVIPVELISSIYEQFAHAQPADPQEGSSEAKQNGVHYTRLSLVSLVLDEVMDGLDGTETVLDLTCGSGVFLVEALRRLVLCRAKGTRIDRSLVREVLYGQVYGVDVSETAIRVAAFSLYLAALELDPDPQPPESLTFKPLIGKTLICADARGVEKTEEGRAIFLTEESIRRFDIIVGNPPWSFRGKAGTAKRRKSQRGIPAQPRGEGLDFVLLAAGFSHKKTRFGVVLSALPFFSRSGTGIAAAQHVLKMLAPVTLVNLSILSGWLFATATMPAVVLFARHRSQPADQITVVQIPWSEHGARTQTFEVSSRDINRVTLQAVTTYPPLLKAAAVGNRRDLSLLESLRTRYRSFGDQLTEFPAELNVGMIRGLVKNQTRNAERMRGLPVLEAGNLRAFGVTGTLANFESLKAQWPRARSIYSAPLLVVKETLNVCPRVIAAASETEILYTNAFFGAALPEGNSDAAHLFAAILGSSFASWFFLLTASEFGIWKRRVLRHDVAGLPMPNVKDAVNTAIGRKITGLSREFAEHEPSAEELLLLDDLVCDFYELDWSERLAVQDGFERATWQWQSGRIKAAKPAESQVTVVNYAKTFSSVLEGWLSVKKQRTVRAEVFDLSERSPVRVVRFVIESNGERGTALVSVSGGFEEVLDRLGSRLHAKIATALTATRELRVYGEREVVIIKPAAARHWMSTCALEDADAVVAESFRGLSVQ